MEKLTFDTGMKSYRINGGGVLRFNPADPNVYSRFLEARPALDAVGKQFRKKAKSAADGQAVLKLLTEADGQLKAVLETVFPGNDFNAALGGANLLALGSDGKTLAQALLSALEEALSQGVKRFADGQAEKLLG